MQQLILRKSGKKTYYRDPLKLVYRNIENPKDILTPNTKIAIGRLLAKARDVKPIEDW